MPTPLHKKLRIQPGYNALVVNAPADYFELLGPLPERVDFSKDSEEAYDFVHLFVKDQAELEARIDTALAAVKYDGLFWVSYPKGSSGVKTDINRDSLWEILLEKGIRPVTQVSIDKTWSALRFRPTEAVDKK
jgi:hypothetical protein